MKIVMVSNYFNHHQQPLAEALYRICDRNFCFIATTTMRQERKDLGYGNRETPQYVLEAWTDEEGCRRIIDEADVVIAGSAPEQLLRARIAAGKPIFRYSERPLKNGTEPLKYLPRLLRWHLRNPVGKPISMLAAGAFAAGDYARFGLFKKRCYRWGYFPETKRYPDAEGLMKRKDRVNLVWVARLLHWKHPDDVIGVAKRLKESGYRFELNMIGIGPMEQTLRDMIREEGLEACVHLLGAMKPEEVRTHMEDAGIFLFTSDRNEGWGAVLNEAMNSGCATVASHAIGSVPFLIEDGQNGLVYRSGDTDELYSKVAYLLDHPAEQVRLGIGAYRTITETWNAESAAERFVCLAERGLAGEKFPDLYENGPCSKAVPIKENWYHR